MVIRNGDSFFSRATLPSVDQVWEYSRPALIRSTVQPTSRCQLATCEVESLWFCVVELIEVTHSSFWVGRKPLKALTGTGIFAIVIMITDIIIIILASDERNVNNQIRFWSSGFLVVRQSKEAWLQLTAQLLKTSEGRFKRLYWMY